MNQLPLPSSRSFAHLFTLWRKKIGKNPLPLSSEEKIGILVDAYVWLNIQYTRQNKIYVNRIKRIYILCKLCINKFVKHDLNQGERANKVRTGIKGISFIVNLCMYVYDDVSRLFCKRWSYLPDFYLLNGTKPRLYKLDSNPAFIGLSGVKWCAYLLLFKVFLLWSVE